MPCGCIEGSKEEGGGGGRGGLGGGGGGLGQVHASHVLVACFFCTLGKDMQREMCDLRVLTLSCASLYLSRCLSPGS